MPLATSFVAIYHLERTGIFRGRMGDTRTDTLRGGTGWNSWTQADSDWANFRRNLTAWDEAGQAAMNS